MGQTQIIVIFVALVFLLFSLGILGYFFLVASNKESAKKERQTFQSADFIKAAIKDRRAKVSNLELKLKNATWTLPPLAFNIFQVVISITACYLASLKFNLILTLMALSIGPLIMNLILDFAVNRRFKAFDNDYPSFIMSVVGLLKTGMNTTTALEVAAKGMEDGSLVKEEVLLMLERLRFGVSEERSIGAFAEDINHPEIELFVQALLLSKRVGGNLSETLERLAKQVRTRQQFREDAKSAVGLQKGSIVFILCILVAIEFYLYLMYPEAITGSIKDETGWNVWQIGILVMLFGIWWLSRIIKIKV